MFLWYRMISNNFPQIWSPGCSMEVHIRAWGPIFGRPEVWRTLINFLSRQLSPPAPTDLSGKRGSTDPPNRSHDNKNPTEATRARSSPLLVAALHRLRLTQPTTKGPWLMDIPVHMLCSALPTVLNRSGNFKSAQRVNHFQKGTKRRSDIGWSNVRTGGYRKRGS